MWAQPVVSLELGGYDSVGGLPPVGARFETRIHNGRLRALRLHLLPRGTEGPERDREEERIEHPEPLDTGHLAESPVFGPGPDEVPGGDVPIPLGARSGESELVRRVRFQPRQDGTSFFAHLLDRAHHVPAGLAVLENRLRRIPPCARRLRCCSGRSGRSRDVGDGGMRSCREFPVEAGADPAFLQRLAVLGFDAGEIRPARLERDAVRGVGHAAEIGVPATPPKAPMPMRGPTISPSGPSRRITR